MVNKKKLSAKIEPAEISEKKPDTFNSDDDLEIAEDAAGELEEDRALTIKEAEADNKKNIDDSQNKNKASSEVVINKSKIVLAQKLLENIKENNEKLIRLLSVFVDLEDETRISIGQMLGENDLASDDFAGPGSQVGKVIEGVFDGENMIGPDGKQYSMPANYASKSKLVEGDILKLTITPAGTFVYKQIGPIERARIIGILERDSDGNFSVKADGQKWRVLPASVTYFKGGVGDEVVLLIPKAGESKWGAVENIIKTKE